jgi:hypothetical protein
MAVFFRQLFLADGEIRPHRLFRPARA